MGYKLVIMLANNKIRFNFLKKITKTHDSVFETLFCSLFDNYSNQNRIDFTKPYYLRNGGRAWGDTPHYARLEWQFGKNILSDENILELLKQCGFITENNNSSSSAAKPSRQNAVGCEREYGLLENFIISNKLQLIALKSLEKGYYHTVLETEISPDNAESCCRELIKFSNAFITAFHKRKEDFDFIYNSKVRITPSFFPAVSSTAVSSNHNNSVGSFIDFNENQPLNFTAADRNFTINKNPR